MNKKLTPLSSQALEALAKIVGDRYSGSEISALFAKSGLAHISHDGSTKWRFVFNAFEQMQRQEDGNPVSVLKVIKTMCQPIEYVSSPHQYEQTLGSVNRILAFYGLRIEEDGRLISGVPPARTATDSTSEDALAFDRRGFHAHVIAHGKIHFCRGAYFHAVFESCKAFDSAVRSSTGSSVSGRELMSQALNENGPIKFNGLRNDSERSEQQGLMHLGMGLMAAVRNPQAHEPEKEWPMSREDALDLLGLISFLFRKLEGAVVVPPNGKGAVKVQL